MRLRPQPGQVEAGREIRAVEEDAVHSGAIPVLLPLPYRPPGDIEDIQFDVGWGGQGEAEAGRGIEGIGEAG